MAINREKRFQEDCDYRVYRIKHFGKKYSWKFLSDIEEMVFSNTEATLRIDAVKLIIQTELRHPKMGETKLVRRGDFTMNMVEKIFCNPRAHMPSEIKAEHVK